MYMQGRGPSRPQYAASSTAFCLASAASSFARTLATLASMPCTSSKTPSIVSACLLLARVLGEPAAAAAMVALPRFSSMRSPAAMDSLATHDCSAGRRPKGAQCPFCAHLQMASWCTRSTVAQTSEQYQTCLHSLQGSRCTPSAPRNPLAPHPAQTARPRVLGTLAAADFGRPGPDANAAAAPRPVVRGADVGRALPVALLPPVLGV
eukprot:CAMPEP_0202887310 /NCGR_PEP_ID=MMETSP1391-20130828/42618_1 /ASSEMBLY_ACC=CAM_ASM_000867 /TAXON_ID=1034604 /ORGANISM="Chlamydomonas leiostraca, Strain SAG 11-49" /LENGTH=206 /DNA_ID=CAMNT_0049570595 /DNA_START=214 /DNA_END=834 /DNA_ORIENTATION=-